MSPRIHRLGLLLACLFASEVWALGLGDIRLDSALNEPLQAEIALLSATQEELDNLRISLASNETFERYGIDRPLFLSGIQFRVQGSAVQVTSQEPITEPFVTFLVEAVWSRGRLLREYTVLLDPPTFAPPPTAPVAEAVTAPRQGTEADRGRIERPAPAAPRATPPARQASPAPDAGSPVFDTAAGGEYVVQRGDTLWRIAEDVRPDARLTMNQTMLAIYEANPQAFANNINVLRANARLRVPSADEIFRISRAAALSEIRRQNQSWRGETTSAPQPTLTLVPPDAEQQPYQSPAGAGAERDAGAPTAATDDGRIRELESRVAEQESLLEIRDSELARLRSELQRLRQERAAAADDSAVLPDMDDATAGEVVDGIFIDDEPVRPTVDDEPVTADVAADAPAAQPAPQVVAAPQPESKGLVGTLLGFLTSIWGLLVLALLVAVGVLMWFARRASGTSGDAEDTGTWESLGGDDGDDETAEATQRLRALAREDDSSIVVVEQSGGDTIASDKVNIPGLAVPGAAAAATPRTDEAVSLEDTFSSETAINLDQSDPVAEADFHMAYGLYDQAADLINGALAIEPERPDLLAKLCEIYFVWGNRDSFVSAASNLKTALGDDKGGEWDKIVIMGQQIAPEESMFAHASPGGVATQAVDLDFEEAGDSAGSLDIDFAGGDSPDADSLEASSVIDLGAESPMSADANFNDDMLDFSFDDDADPDASATREMPKDIDGDSTVESPTIEQEAVGRIDSTAELPIASNDLEARLSELETEQFGDETAEIDLDDLGLDLDTLRGEVSGDMLASANESASDFTDEMDETAESPMLDSDRTGQFPAAPDDQLLDATGQTQVLTEDFGSDSKADNEDNLSDDDATMLAPGLGAKGSPDFDFAATEALPRDAFDGDDASLDATAETPAFTATEMDLDLDDLTAALKLSESGDTIEQKRDEETVERPAIAEDGDLDFDFDIGAGDMTQEIAPGGVSDELREARTMTEVGTKLDLARAYVDMGDPGGARNILEEVLEEGDEAQRQQAQRLLDSLPS